MAESQPSGQFGVQVARTTSNVELMSTIQECWLESVAADPGLDQFGEITRVIAPEPAASSRIAAGKRVLFLFRCVEGCDVVSEKFHEDRVFVGFRLPCW